MNRLKSLPAAILGLIAVVLLAFGIDSLINGGAPGASTVKEMVEKPLIQHYKGCVIKSITITRGGMFPCQGQRGQARQGTPIYPTFVKVIYTVPAANGSGEETREFTKTLYLYKDTSHHWARDTDLN
jgi:hypothetical protein